MITYTYTHPYMHTHVNMHTNSHTLLILLTMLTILFLHHWPKLITPDCGEHMDGVLTSPLIDEHQLKIWSFAV